MGLRVLFSEEATEAWLHFWQGGLGSGAGPSPVHPAPQSVLLPGPPCCPAQLLATAQLPFSLLLPPPHGSRGHRSVCCPGPDKAAAFLVLGRPPAAACPAMCPLGGTGAQGQMAASLPGCCLYTPGHPSPGKHPPAPHTRRSWPLPPSPAARALHSGIRPRDPAVVGSGSLVEEGFISVSRSVPAYLLEKVPLRRAGWAFLTRPDHVVRALVCVAIVTTPQCLCSLRVFKTPRDFLFCLDSPWRLD